MIEICLKFFKIFLIFEKIQLFNASYPQFGPSLETYMTDDDTFLNEEPFTLLARGAFNKIPYILGLTSNEGLLLNAAGNKIQPHFDLLHFPQ